MSEAQTEMEAVQQNQEVENLKSTKKRRGSKRKSRSKKKPAMEDAKKNEPLTADPQFDDVQGDLKMYSSKKNAKADNNLNKPQRQTKLNYYLRKGDPGNSNSENNSESRFAISEYERKRIYLEEEIKGKDNIIERLKTENQSISEKYGKIRYDHQQMKTQTKQIMEQRMREAAEFRRRQKQEIEVKYGYFKKAGYSIFIQGEYLISARKKTLDLEKKIKDLEDTKRNLKDQDQRQRAKYQIDFLKKNILQTEDQLSFRESQLTAYKQRLLMAEKQTSCNFAKQGWPLVNDRYLPMQLLGSGGFGEVYKCYDLEENSNVALKVNCFEPIKSSEGKEQFLKHVERQVQILKGLDHPNIARLFEEIVVDSDNISFVMEYCSGPELSKYLKSHKFLEEKQAKGVVKQISFALKYLQEQKNRIIHYDLKPSNIIFHNGVVKVLDFGLCKIMESENTKIDLTSQGVGTYWYLPPETFLDNAQICNKLDVWSLGVIFFQMLYGRRPFGHGVNQNKIYTEGIILKAINVEFPTSNDKKFKVSDEAKQFICECLKYDVKDRLDPIQVYNHPYLN